MKAHIQILSLAADRLLPNIIDSQSRFSLPLVRRLIKAGLLRGEVKYSHHDIVIAHPAITVQGRRYLADRLNPRFENSFFRLCLQAEADSAEMKNRVAFSSAPRANSAEASAPH